jgi:hypothetical protein
LMTFSGTKGAVISKPIKSIREDVIAWIIEKKDKIRCIPSLMQHICLGTPDKAEYRTLACQVRVILSVVSPS